MQFTDVSIYSVVYSVIKGATNSKKSKPMKDSKDGLLIIDRSDVPESARDTTCVVPWILIDREPSSDAEGKEYAPGFGRVVAKKNLSSSTSIEERINMNDYIVEVDSKYEEPGYEILVRTLHRNNTKIPERRVGGFPKTGGDIHKNSASLLLSGRNMGDINLSNNRTSLYVNTTRRPIDVFDNDNFVNAQPLPFMPFYCYEKDDNAILASFSNSITQVASDSNMSLFNFKEEKPSRLSNESLFSSNSVVLSLSDKVEITIPGSVRRGFKPPVINASAISSTTSNSSSPTRNDSGGLPTLGLHSASCLSDSVTRYKLNEAFHSIEAYSSQFLTALAEEIEIRLINKAVVWYEASLVVYNALSNPWTHSNRKSSWADADDLESDTPLTSAPPRDKIEKPSFYLYSRDSPQKNNLPNGYGRVWTVTSPISITESRKYHNEKQQNWKFLFISKWNTWSKFEDGVRMAVEPVAVLVDSTSGTQFGSFVLKSKSSIQELLRKIGLSNQGITDRKTFFAKCNAGVNCQISSSYSNGTDTFEMLSRFSLYNLLALPLAPILLCKSTASIIPLIDTRDLPNDVVDDVLSRFIGGSEPACKDYTSESSEFDDNKSTSRVPKVELNDDQQEVFKACARWFRPKSFIKNPTPIVLVHGVFGSGKSFLLVNIIQFMMMLSDMGNKFNLRVLVACHTNAAIDRILIELLKHGFTDFIRIGSIKNIDRKVFPYTVHSTAGEDLEKQSNGACEGALRELQSLLADDKMNSRDTAEIIMAIAEAKNGKMLSRAKSIQTFNVVGITCSSIPTLTLLQELAGDKRGFDVVILDEASQITESMALVPIIAARAIHTVIVGDDHQLPPIIGDLDQSLQRGLDNGLGRTLFSRLKSGYLSNAVGISAYTLPTQYRCPSIVSSLVSSLFYCNIIRNGNKDVATTFPQLCLINVQEGKDEFYHGSWLNRLEASAVIEMIRYIKRTTELKSLSVGVIVPYIEQNKEICLALSENNYADVQVKTVDSFQGNEMDIIILSTVRTTDNSSRIPSFIDNDKRLNVALTRVKRHLIIVGNVSYLLHQYRWNDVLQYIGEKNCPIVDLQKSASSLQEILGNLPQHLRANPYRNKRLVAQTKQERSVKEYSSNKKYHHGMKNDENSPPRRHIIRNDFEDEILHITSPPKWKRTLSTSPLSPLTIQAHSTRDIVESNNDFSKHLDKKLKVEKSVEPLDISDESSLEMENSVSPTKLYNASQEFKQYLNDCERLKDKELTLSQQQRITEDIDTLCRAEGLYRLQELNEIYDKMFDTSSVRPHIDTITNEDDAEGDDDDMI